MKCMKCNHALPDDSVFCQYCGNRIEKTAVKFEMDVAVVDEVVTASEVTGKDDVVDWARADTSKQSAEEVAPPLPDFKVMELEEVPKPMAGAHAQETISTMNANYQSQPGRKSEMGGVLVPEKALKAKKVKQPKKKYCSRCGTLIDPQSKQCTGCGKKKFKGIKINKFAVTITVLSLVIAALVGTNVYQYLRYSGIDEELRKKSIIIENLEVENENLEGEVERLSTKVFDQGLTLDRQKQMMEFMEERDDEYSEVVNFCEDHVEIICDDGTNSYHKYGCIYLDLSRGFLIYNTETAEGRGYIRCPYCHYNQG